LVKTIEVPSIIKCFKDFGENYNPDFSEIIVTKRIDDRFFLKGGSLNPRSGTIISEKVISNNFEFFLVA